MRLAAARTGVSTARAGKVYVHLFERPAGGKLALPPVDARRAYLLDGGAAVPLAKTTTGVSLTLPPALPDPNVTVVVLEVGPS